MVRNFRQVRYHIGLDTCEQTRLPHEWTFFIMNEPREIERIKGKIFIQLAPSDEYLELSGGLVKETGGLHHLAYTIQSGNGRIRREQWEKIYNASDQIYMDRDLGSMPVGKAPDIWFPQIYIPRITRIPAPTKE